jgi:predicted ester cyclase
VFKQSMTKDQLSDLYRDYIGCLNAQDWHSLGRFVHKDARYNGRAFGLAGYRAMLEQDFREIPDLRFNIALVVADPPMVGARLTFDCRPKGLFLGLPVNGRRIAFVENVFYEFRDAKIAEVWSVIDKPAIEAQL